jgi:site-specific DNA-methyltransferase (adenine-specific)
MTRFLRHQNLQNQILDMLTESWAKDHKGENIWENKDVKFLDPCTKSGVFLRGITGRLTQGLEKKIPNLEKRVDHILSKQVYGIGITKLTSFLARRSVYCSKSADGETFRLLRVLIVKTETFGMKI